MYDTLEEAKAGSDKQVATVTLLRNEIYSFFEQLEADGSKNKYTLGDIELALGAFLFKRYGGEEYKGEVEHLMRVGPCFIAKGWE